MQKLTLLFVITIINLTADTDTNESKIFLDKYDARIEKVKKEININQDAGDISACKLVKDTNISEQIRLDVKNIIDNRITDEHIERVAKFDAEVINTDEFKKQFNEAKQNLLYDKKLNWGEQAAIAQQHIASQKEGDEQNFYFNSSEIIYIFISSSMPKETIKNYLESIKNIQNNIVFVLQGAIGGMQKIKPTLLWIKEILGKEYASAKIIIDPRLSLKFKIKQAPAILYTQMDMFDMKSEEVSSQSITTNADTYIVYGDMPLKYVINKMNEKKQNFFLEEILKKLETK
ncbi:MAG: TrbC family F-type conjugative pilus assembly protein [Sulfurimonas sp.]|jgi:type-F conjugative transfer system pilin assembly protein TrbC